jgi:hypothetical protein
MLMTKWFAGRRSNARSQEREHTDDDSDAASSSSSTHSTIHMPAGTPPRMNSLERNGADADTENDVFGNVEAQSIRNGKADGEQAQVEYRKHDSGDCDSGMT